MRRRTKIICTIGPAVSSYEKILELIDAGMNVARLNFSHGTHEDHQKVIDNLKKARKEKGIPLAILLDNKGPEIRVGNLTKPYLVDKGSTLVLTKDKAKNEGELPICPGIALDPLEKGDLVLFDDGYVCSEVSKVSPKGVEVTFLNEGHIKTRKGVNMPHVNVPLPALTAQDIEDIKFGCRNDVDIIAASFIRSAEHVRQIKALLLEEGKGDILVISKIENGLGVQNFESIVQISDGIMVARGDLGVELPIEEVPILQKMMIRSCIKASKPVVTATQMLESMIENPRPTRAEASDVANAIYDGTSAVMLSGETAIGKYPIEAVKVMRNIIKSTEEDVDFQEFFYRDSREVSHNVSFSIALAGVKAAYSLGAKAIFAFTKSGSTAQVISHCRPEMPIVSLSPNEKTYHQLAFAWGVIPVFPQKAQNAREALFVTSNFARKKGIVQFGDLVVVTAGTPFGQSGSTNTVMVESIGEVLVRGDESKGEKIFGQVYIVLTVDTYAIESAKGKIVVLSKFDKEYEPIIEHAKAIVLQNLSEDYHSEELAAKVAKERNIPILIRADQALTRLQNGQSVILDPEKGTIYKKTST